MRVLIFAPFACALGHHETDVELAKSHSERGDEVHVIQCRAEQKICDVNPSHKMARCIICRSTSNASFSLAGIPKSRLHPLALENIISTNFFPTFETLESLKNYQWEGLPAGHAVASSLIMLERNTGPDMKRHQQYISQMLSMWVETYHALSSQIDKIKPDLFYVFNARIGSVSAAFHAAQRKNIRTLVCDRNSYDDYLLYENTISNDLEYCKKQLKYYAEQMKEDPNAEKLCAEWFEMRKKPKREIYGNYLEFQNINLLPRGFDPNKRNIGIFVSSEDELFITPGWENPIYKDQNDAIHQILKTFSDDRYHFYLRIHPNLGTLENLQNKQLALLTQTNLTKILPLESVDTYALIEACEKNITFGSTVGIESVYWRKPSILIGHSVAENLNAMYCPKNHIEVVDLIEKNLAPHPREKAFPYAYWAIKSAIQYRYVEPRRDNMQPVGGINGSPLVPSKFVRFILGLFNQKHRMTVFLTKLRKEIKPQRLREN